MYITDLTHFLDKSGAIGPVKGPARTMAQFNVDAVAHASDSTSETLPAPKCFKCKKGVVEAVLAQDNAVVWICPKCHIVSVSSQFDGPMITIDDAEQPSLSVISDGVLANGDFAIKFSDVHQGHDQKRRQR